jgi:MFS family permease
MATDTVAAISSLLRVRIAITTFFALGGFIFAGWAVRIPAIKEQTAASASELGLALLAMSGAAVVTMLGTGKLCERFGSRQVTIATSLLLSVSVLLPALADSAVKLGVVLLVFGCAYGGIDVAINSVAVDLITVIRRPIMASLHAANSIGSLAGAGLGALVAPYLLPTWHLLLLVPVGLAVTVIAGRMLLTHPLSQSDSGRDIQKIPLKSVTRLRTSASTPVVLFGLIGLCAAYAQGGMDSWGPLHIVEDLDAGAGVAAAGYAVVQLTIAAGRLSGTTLVERVGQTRVMVFGGLVACLGTLLAAWAPSLWLVFVGLTATGLGLSNIFPAAIAGAGALGGPHGVALASTLGYGGIMLAPPTIGFVADAFGLPSGITMIAALTAVAAVVAYSVRHETRRLATA